jgi:hypothetical protein
MYLVLIAWSYVVLMMAVAEATSSAGTLLGALITLVFYGALPLAIVMYLLNTPARRRARRAAQQRPAPHVAAADPDPSTALPDPDQGNHPARHAIAAEREKP